jgi:exonuclease III
VTEVNSNSQACLQQLMYWNVRGSIDRCLALSQVTDDCGIICFGETWMTEQQARGYTLHATGTRGYRHFFACRDNNKMHGGLSVFVRKDIQVTLVHKQTAPELLALSFGDKELLVLACYASPHGSEYSGGDNVFDTIAELLHTLQVHKHTIIIGDMNARIGNRSRSLAALDILDPLGLNEGFANRGQTRIRNSMDLTVCKRGKQCIRFLNQMCMDVLNGTCRGDEEGRFTSHSSGGGESVVDLAIVSTQMHTHIHTFSVSDDILVTDHSQLWLTFRTYFQNDQGTVTGTGAHQKCIWNQRRWREFGSHVNRTIATALPPATSIHNSTKSEIESLCTTLCKTLAKCTHKAFRGNRRGAQANEHPFWDTECELAKQHVVTEHARCRSMGLRSDRTLRIATNRLKTIVKMKRRDARTRTDIELSKKLRGDPGSFWDAWKEKRSRNKIDDADAFLAHFDSVLNDGVGNDEVPDVVSETPGPTQAAPINPIGVGGHSTARGGHTAKLEVAAAELLNSPIRESEVVIALKALQNRKSTVDGFKGEIFKYAKVWQEDTKIYSYCVGEHLAAIFNRIYIGGLGIPKDWHKATLVPIYKGKGSELALDNYRGVTITCTLYKVYAMILNRRLDNACEAHGVRAETQCGFRKKHGTIAAHLAMHHAIHTVCSPRSKGGMGRTLYACFVDFKKAFDAVPRAHIWSRMQEIGINGHFLRAVQDLYSDTTLRVKVNGKTSAGYILTASGVKQGCPLSPLLFGLFIEQLHETLKAECPDIGVVFCDEQRLRDLLYADDVTMMTLDAQELQRLCTCLHKFSKKYKMGVNVPKTKITAFMPPRGLHVPTIEVMYDQQLLEIENCFKLLGLPVHEKDWYRGCAQHLADTAERAMWATIRRMQDLSINCLDVKIRIFNTMVMSVGSYGCQVWGVDFLRCKSERDVFNNPLQSLVLKYLRMITGCNRSTSRWVLLRECGIQPVQVQWACLCARIWNTEVTKDTLTGRTLKSDTHLYLRGCDKCWVGQFLGAMAGLGLITGRNTAQAVRGCDLDTIIRWKFEEDRIREAYLRAHGRLTGEPSVGDDPRTAPSRGLAVVRHDRWFRNDNNVQLLFSAPEFCVKSLIRFRTSSTTTLRVHDHSMDRTRRICRKCRRHEIEDEKHVIFECDLHVPLRLSARWGCLFQGQQDAQDMRKFMSHHDQYKLSFFIVHILRARALAPDIEPV